MEKINKISKFLYSDGCSFLVPYGLIFFVAWTTKIPIYFAQSLYTTLHIFNIVLFLLYIVKFKSSANKYNSVLAVSIVFLTFFANGVYLEFPSDAWEYFKYIFDYNALTTVRFDSYAPENIRFTYFFSWTLISNIPIEYRRLGLSFIASFWQTLLAVQIFLLSKRVGSNTRNACLQTFAAVIFIGYANLNYFAYLSLSSTLACFTFNFRGVIAMIDFAKSQKIKPLIAGLLISIIGISTTHTQGFLLLIISALAIGFYKWFIKQNFKPTKRAFAAYILISQSVLFFGWFYMIIRQYQFRLSTIGLTDMPKMLRMADIYSATLGFHGLLNASLALFFLFRFPLLTVLSLMPVFLIIFPPTLKAIRFIMPYSLVSHRTLYAFPACFFLVLALDWVFKKIFPNRLLVQTISIIIFLLLLAWPNEYPWQGRLQNLVVHPPPELDLRILDPLPVWLEENRQVSKTHCLYQSDRVTINFLASHFSSGKILPRTSTTSLWYNKVDSVPYYMNLPSYCGILSVHPERLPDFPNSETNRVAHHWDDKAVNMKLLYPQTHVEILELAATQNNWKKTEVPPFYILYEPR